VSENGPISDIFGNDTETATKSKMRIVAVSATLPNISDIAAFLDVQEAFSFDESYRPVTLQVHVVGLGYKGTNPYLFDKNLDRHVPELLDRFSEGKPAIVFCHSKKETERLAADLASRSGSSDHPRLFEISMKTNSSMLQRCLRQGVAFHHAGMEAENRRLVEHTFSNGLLRCLCATSTLAVGVNMPG
jgi:ATP-dependent DNA helicase HFM1/MER3